MVQDIYDPLAEYVNVFRDRFREVARSTFAQLSEEAKIDVEANREVCRQMYALEESISSLRQRISRWKALKVILWVVIVIGAFVALNKYQSASWGWLVLLGLLIVAALIVNLRYVSPTIQRMRDEQGGKEDEVSKLKDKAWEQMQPLNRLYDWDIFTRMMSKTVPRLEFDPYFTVQRLADLKKIYGWDDSFNEGRSVIFSHSGLINGNPFIICRTRSMTMGTKTYQGEKTIYWTTRERGSDGKYHTVEHSETLTATVTAPYPYYGEKTRLIYGNTAAPDLIFTRKKSGLAGREKSWDFKSHRRQLRKKAQDLTHADYAMLTNEEFETAFDTSNRNSNQEFALLFTPLAQENMMKLLKDHEAGYGDDFDFNKNKMINTIIPDHLQMLNLDMNPARYKNFDYDKAEKDFCETNAEYFRAVYFALAPLLCVPMYQQIRSREDIYGKDMPQHSSFWEHEALANFWGEDHFKHPSCVTPCILKTEQSEVNGDDSMITVYAYGYRSEQRVTYVSKHGGDGRWHNVPVYWDEYLPVVGSGQMRVHEDNSTATDEAPSQKNRLHHIHEILKSKNMSVYRRHIASVV